MFRKRRLHGNGIKGLYGTCSSNSRCSAYSFIFWLPPQVHSGKQQSLMTYSFSGTCCDTIWDASQCITVVVYNSVGTAIHKSMNAQSISDTTDLKLLRYCALLNNNRQARVPVKVGHYDSTSDSFDLLPRARGDRWSPETVARGQVKFVVLGVLDFSSVFPVLARFKVARESQTSKNGIVQPRQGARRGNYCGESLF